MFAVTAENASAVRDVCRRLDGIPLAIELAAARATMMSPVEILGRLDQRFRLLTGGSRSAVERHQTLRAAIEWSYDLLDDSERRLFDRLSVFSGDFDLEAVVAVAVDAGHDPFDVVDHLGSLVAKCLVEHTESAGATRYRLLETIRQYAAERLDADGDTDDARDCHASYYLALGGELFGMLKTVRDFDALERLRVETPNLAAAARWLLDTGRVADAFGFFADLSWVDTGLLPFALLDELGRIGDEALSQANVAELRGYPDVLFYAGVRAFFVGDVEHLQHLVSLADPDDEPPVSVLNILMAEAAMRGDFPSAISIGQRAVQRAREVDDPGTLSFMLGLLTLAEQVINPGALSHAEEAVEVARRSPATSALLYPLFILAVAAQRSDPERALAAAEECARVDRTDRKAWSTVCEAVAAKIRVNSGAIAAGLRLWRDVLRRFDWTGEVVQISLQLPNLADSVARRDPGLAVELAAISESKAIAPFGAFDAAGYNELAGAVNRLGPKALESARERAASMSYDDAMAFVFEAIERLIVEAPNHELRPTPATP